MVIGAFKTSISSAVLKKRDFNSSVISCLSHPTIAGHCFFYNAKRRNEFEEGLRPVCLTPTLECCLSRRPF